MARLKLPLLSATAFGSFAKSLTFAKNRAVQYVKKFQTKFYSRTSRQDLMRCRFSVCNLVWEALPAIGRSFWALYFKDRPYCKNNSFMKTNLNTGYPCREVPEIPGAAYNRKSEYIMGLAKIGITPMGINYLYVNRWT